MEVLDNKRVHRLGLKAVFHNRYKNTNLPAIYADNLINRTKWGSGDRFYVLILKFYQRVALGFSLIRAID
jgi:hypothetical protein